MMSIGRLTRLLWQRTPTLACLGAILPSSRVPGGWGESGSVRIGSRGLSYVPVDDMVSGLSEDQIKVGPSLLPSAPDIKIII